MNNQYRDMSDIVIVTNHETISENNLTQLAQSNTKFIILRAKELSAEDYYSLSEKSINICNRFNKKLILHTHTDTALKLKHPHIHLTFPDFLKLDKNMLSSFKTIGVSIHSIDEAVTAQKEGATYLLAGHIFVTDCKKGIPPKGVNWLRIITSTVTIPIYAIGGIRSSAHLKQVIDAGADGGCMMSSALNYYINS